MLRADPSRQLCKQLLQGLFIVERGVPHPQQQIVLLQQEASAREQAAVSLRESVLSAAKQCCAVEGAYPSSLAHLEEHYGLTINHDDFIVNYEWFADNVLPAVVVVTR